VSNRYIIPVGKEWSISRLEELHPPLDPAICLNLAARYHIQSWILPAVCQLLDRFENGGRRIRAITDMEIGVMGIVAYSAIGRADKAIRAERYKVCRAQIALYHDAPDCRVGLGARRKCEDSWNLTLQTKMPGILLNPDSYTPLADLPSVLSTLYFPNVNVVCKSLSIEKLKASHCVTIEETIKQLAADKLWEQFGP